MQIPLFIYPFLPLALILASDPFAVKSILIQVIFIALLYFNLFHVFLFCTWLCTYTNMTVGLYYVINLYTSFGALVPLLRGNPESRAATSRCTWKHRKRQTEAYILLRDHNSVKLYNQRDYSSMQECKEQRAVQILTSDAGCCARCGSSAVSQYSAPKVFCMGHHLFNILEMGKALPWSSTLA